MRNFFKYTKRSRYETERKYNLHNHIIQKIRNTFLIFKYVWMIPYKILYMKLIVVKCICKR